MQVNSLIRELHRNYSEKCQAPFKTLLFSSIWDRYKSTKTEENMEIVCNFCIYLICVWIIKEPFEHSPSEDGLDGVQIDFFYVTKAIQISVCVIFKLTINTTGYLDTYNLCAITFLERQVPAYNYWEYKPHYNEYSSEFQARACQTL